MESALPTKCGNLRFISLKNIQQEEQKFLEGITEKYGQGTLNPDTGVFTPNKSE